MKTIKNWQCPHCDQECDRHWNLVVHIRRWHRGIGQPIDQGNIAGGKKTSFSNLNATHIRKRSQSSYNSSRVPVNYYNQTKDREDVIDEVHRFFTEIDEKRRKIEEIIEIRNKYSMVPISMPYINPNYISTKDMEELSHPKPSNDKPHSHKAPIQSHDYTFGIASQKSKTENGPQDLIQSKKKETKWWSIRTEYLFEPDRAEWDVNIPPKRIWVCKRNLFGDIIDVYKVFEAPYEELRDLSKRWWKNNTLHQ